ncbi:MAG: hypothetical protein NZM07_07060 [Elioraea sp.]|nr:hypothetical protein [Elioraea sp.]
MSSEPESRTTPPPPVGPAGSAAGGAPHASPPSTDVPPAEEVERARLVRLFGPLPEETLALLVQYERIHRDGGPGSMAGAMRAHQIRHRLPAETAALDAVRRAASAAADAADPTWPLRRALLRLRRALAADVTKAQEVVQEKEARVKELDSVLEALSVLRRG